MTTIKAEIVISENEEATRMTNKATPEVPEASKTPKAKATSKVNAEGETKAAKKGVAAKAKVKSKSAAEKADALQIEKERQRAEDLRLARNQRKNAMQRQRRRQSTVELTGTRMRTNLKAADQVSFLSESYPTIEEVFEYRTAFMHKFISDRGDKVMQVCERLAATLRTLSSITEVRPYNELSDWVAETISEARQELQLITEQRKLLERTAPNISDVAVKSPQKFKVKFQFTTPVGRQVVAILRAVDEELACAQRLYFAGALNDVELAVANRQGLRVLNSLIDKVFKVTSPGKREGGAYSPDALLAAMRSEYSGSATNDDVVFSAFNKEEQEVSGDLSEGKEEPAPEEIKAD